MTKLLELAINSVRNLTPLEQDAVAQILLDELESERLWEHRLSRGDAALLRMAEQAWEEHEARKTMPLDPEQL